MENKTNESIITIENFNVTDEGSAKLEAYHTNQATVIETLLEFSWAVAKSRGMGHEDFARVLGMVMAKVDADNITLSVKGSIKRPDNS